MNNTLANNSRLRLQPIVLVFSNVIVFTDDKTTVLIIVLHNGFKYTHTFSLSTKHGHTQPAEQMTAVSIDGKHFTYGTFIVNTHFHGTFVRQKIKVQILILKTKN